MRKNVGQEIGAGVFGTLLGITLSFPVGLHLGRMDTVELRREAVKVGAARWVPNPDGSTTFVWSSTAARAEALDN